VLRLSPRSRPGFSLVELLVVIALTIILMGLMLGPLNRSFGLVSQGQAKVAAQDNARFGLQRISRDLSDAMVVHTDRPIALWHYSAYEPGTKPSPTGDAVPQAEVVTGAMLDLVMPKMRYFCTSPTGPHYLSDQEVPPGAAIDACPRPEHAGQPLDRRPLEPMQPDEQGTIVRYFIGLRVPYNPPPDEIDGPLPGAASPNPHYVNGFTFPNTVGGFDNTYVLYRVEFNPNDPRVGNWRLPNGQINPNFFYDTAPAPGTDPPLTYAQEWRSRCVAVISSDNTDLVRLVTTDTGFRPEPLLSFGPSPMESEALEPTKSIALVPPSEQSESTPPGGEPSEPTTEPLVESGVPPSQYRAEYGHWNGPDPTLMNLARPLLPTEIVGSVPPPTAAEQTRFFVGPRIQVYERRPLMLGGEQLALVFDSGVDVGRQPRQRILSWDAGRGIVNFALRRTTTGGNGDPTAFVANLDNNFSVDLKRDTASVTLAGSVLPGGFGAVKNAPALSPSAMIVPGSEEVARSLDGSDTRVTRMQRAGYSGVGAADRIVAPADLQPHEYTIDYRTGVIQFSDRDPNLIGQPVQVRYQWQTNRPTDVVRVTYATRELMTVNVGLNQFDPRTGQPQHLQLSTRVRVRNLGR
jgi:hypothetical protein